MIYLVRGRWRYDEKTDSLVPDSPTTPTAEELAGRETEEARRQREQEERDAHPGNYV